jgi:hypothetical protein
MIEFLGTEPAYGTSGCLRAASNYLFSVEGRVVTVEVYSSALVTSNGQMDPIRVRIAAEAFLELEEERLGSSILTGRLLLNEAAMDAAVYRLGWNPRFVAA